MATKLTADQISDVKFASGTRRSKADWVRYVEDTTKAMKAGEAVGNIEADFPDVKIDHVRHMVRLVLKENTDLGKKYDVGMSEEHGVVLMPKAS